MLAADMDIPAALIGAPADFIAMAGEVASTAGTWLGAPPALRNMADLETSSMSAGGAILGDFERGSAF